MKKTFLLLLVISFVLISNSFVFAEAANTLVSVTADYWMPSIDAEVKSSELAVIGTQIDLVDDLGIDDSQSIPALRASLDLPLFPEILVSYFAIDDSATKSITKTLVYRGITYNIADTVISSYDITHYEALLGFSIINIDAGKLALLVGAKYFEVETSLAAGGVTQTDSVDGPVPVIGVMGNIKLPAKFRVEAIARGLSVEVDNIEAALYDIDVALNYDFNKFFRASAGYRYFMIDAEDNSTNDSVDIKFAGPYIGVTGSF